VESSALDHKVFFREMGELAGANDLHVQCLDPASILGRRHLDTAFINAVANFSSGKNFTRSFPVELLLMLSGQRQIKEAFSLFGISDDVHSFLVFCCSKEAAEAAIGDFSVEGIGDYGKRFESEYRDDIMIRTRKLMRSLDLTCSENEGVDIFSPVESKLKEVFDLAGIPWPETGMQDPSRMEKIICEGINLIHC